MSETQRVGTPIEFWFDFASGYAYFAALEIEALAERHSRTVAWRPFTLGAAFKVTGAQGLGRTPLKREYARRDRDRLARLKGVPTAGKSSEDRIAGDPRLLSSRANGCACRRRIGKASHHRLLPGWSR